MAFKAEVAFWCKILKETMKTLLVFPYHFSPENSSSSPVTTTILNVHLKARVINQQDRLS